MMYECECGRNEELVRRMAGVPFVQVEFPSPHRALLKLQPSYFSSNPQVGLRLILNLYCHSNTRTLCTLYSTSTVRVHVLVGFARVARVPRVRAAGGSAAHEEHRAAGRPERARDQHLRACRRRCGRGEPAAPDIAVCY